MKTYARIDAGRVVEIILPLIYEVDAPVWVGVPVDPQNPDAGLTPPPADWPMFHEGEEAPIEKRFPREVLDTLVDITGVADVQCGYRYIDGVFSPYVEPPPSPSAILAKNTSTRDTLLATATARIAPLQDAVDLGEATAQEEAALLAWKRFRVNVNRVDLTLQGPDWPAAPN